MTVAIMRILDLALSSARWMGDKGMGLFGDDKFMDDEDYLLSRTA